MFGVSEIKTAIRLKSIPFPRKGVLRIRKDVQSAATDSGGFLAIEFVLRVSIYVIRRHVSGGIIAVSYVNGDENVDTCCVSCLKCVKPWQ